MTAPANGRRLTSPALVSAAPSRESIALAFDALGPFPGCWHKLDDLAAVPNSARDRLFGVVVTAYGVLVDARLVCVYASDDDFLSVVRGRLAECVAGVSYNLGRTPWRKIVAATEKAEAALVDLVIFARDRGLL